MMAFDPTRSTAHGFWRFSANYLLSADILYKNLHKEGHVYLPTLNNYALAIELSLKAFLMKRGHSIDDFKMQGNAWSKFKENAEPLHKTIESSIESRLHSHGRSSV